MKESHGSVELSSLSLATAINSRGIYIIQAPKDGQKVNLSKSWCTFVWPCGLATKSWDSVPKTNLKMCATSQVSPDTVLHLLLPDDHGYQEAFRKYSTEELKELLNKLMLMSGRKDHSSNVEVETFSEVSKWLWLPIHRGPSCCPSTESLWLQARPVTLLLSEKGLSRLLVNTAMPWFCRMHGTPNHNP